MQEHIDSTPEEKRPFRCDLCCNSFLKKFELKKHKLKGNHHVKTEDHTFVKIKPFECKICSKTFLTNYELKKHSKRPRVHDEDRLKNIVSYCFTE